jgi:hypothetical protein
MTKNLIHQFATDAVVKGAMRRAAAAHSEAALTMVKRFTSMLQARDPMSLTDAEFAGVKRMAAAVAKGLKVAEAELARRKRAKA